MLAAGKYSTPSSHVRADLYDTVQIPVREEYVALTGSYELAILLNQIMFSRKDELTIDEVKRLSLCDSTKQTIRKKLDKLTIDGFITKRRKGMYGRYFYKAANDVYPQDNSILALIEGLDLRNHPCYLTASILNKFRQFALSNIESVRISANELRQILQTEKSVSLVRLILRRLVKHGYLSECSVGGVYEYSINTQKLTNIFDPQEVERQSSYLTTLFEKYISLTGEDVSNKQTSSWKLSFKRMLVAGYNYGVVRHIIAYIALNKLEHGVMTPTRLKQHYERLKASSYENLSRRKANSFIYKLLHGLLSVRKEREEVETTPAIDDATIWRQAQEFVNERYYTLKNWYSKQVAGVSDVDFEDYLGEAYIIAYNRFKKPNSKPDATAIYYRLKDFMFRRRCTDPDIKRNDDENVCNIIKFYSDDVSEIIERVEIASDEIEVCDAGRSSELYKLLNGLDPRTAEIIKAYHGLDGRTYTFAEIAEKTGLKSAGYISVLYAKGMEQLRSMAPPD